MKDMWGSEPIYAYITSEESDEELPTGDKGKKRKPKKPPKRQHWTWEARSLFFRPCDM
jgi:hypothetical protein